MRKAVLILTLALGLILFWPTSVDAVTPWWEFQAIDTMKYSRDPSREFLSKPDEFRAVVEEQTKQIAETGATHIGIATPYDAEFEGILEAWVIAARRHNLKVWFRGNWSGWESWFGYPRITREEHLQKTIEYIANHPELFEDGDVFSACPECENGGPGDPRMNGDASGHKAFLIAEHQAMDEAFKKIKRNVQTNFNSMNGDVARLIMDKPTTAALGGLVVVDHYVRTPEQLNRDVTEYAARSGGKVVLGEFGAPIPDINGQMTGEQQAEWLKQTLQLLSENPNLAGLSYWTNRGGSTAIWNDDGVPKPAVAVLASYYTPLVAKGQVVNTLGQPLSAVTLATPQKSFVTDYAGLYDLPLFPNTTVTISTPGYVPLELSADALVELPRLELERTSPSAWYSFRLWLKRLTN